MKKEKNIRYVRYADDMIFGIKSSGDSERINCSFRKFLVKALGELKLKATSLELIRGQSKPREMLVLGLLVSIKLNGNLDGRSGLDRA